jgi:hypothetical protein
MTSPIIGLGGGAYEGKIFGAADYYYETVHTHNHYIQSFIDGGIIGFALFAALAVFSILCLVKTKKEKKNADLFFPILAGSVLMIFLHSLLEVDFSSPAFKSLASVLFALSAAFYEKSFAPGKKTRIAAASLVPAITAATLLLAGGRFIAVNTLQSEKSLDALEKGVILDPFNGDDYKVSYLLNTMNGNESAIAESNANSYRESIESRPISPDTAILLSKYYMMKDVPDYNRGIELAEYYIHEKKVNPKAWDEVLSGYAAVEGAASAENKALLASSILRLADYLNEINSGLPKQVSPELIASQAEWAAKLPS